MSSSKSCYRSPCAACKYLRRKCFSDCVFAPHFPADETEIFEIARQTYGASNIFKILSQLSPDERREAAASLVYEAEARRIDPVYGCVGFISILSDRLKQIQSDLVHAKRELAIYSGSEAPASSAAASVSILQFGAGSSSTTPDFLAQLPRLRAVTRQSLNDRQFLVQSSQQSAVDNVIRQSLNDQQFLVNNPQPSAIDNEIRQSLNDQQFLVQSSHQSAIDNEIRQSLNDQQFLVHNSQQSTIDSEIRQALSQESEDQPQEMQLIANSEGFGFSENDQIQIQTRVEDQMSNLRLLE